MASPDVPDPNLDQNKDRDKRRILRTDVKLTMGMLWYVHVDGANRTVRAFPFQFNPTEIERTRSIQVTRSATGNTVEEGRGPNRNQPKHKQTRKPDPWQMSLTLHYDASYPFPKIPASGTSNNPDADKGPNPVFRVPANLSASLPTQRDFDGITLTQNIELARKFFEMLVEPAPFDPNVAKVANADEAPPAPKFWLTFGSRTWLCAANSLRIKEEDYTHDLCPRRLEITLAVEAIENTQLNNNGKGGADR